MVESPRLVPRRLDGAGRRLGTGQDPLPLVLAAQELGLVRLDFGRGIAIAMLCICFAYALHMLYICSICSVCHDWQGLLADCMLQAIRSPQLKETIMPLDVFLDEDVPDFPFAKAEI